MNMRYNVLKCVVTTNQQKVHKKLQGHNSKNAKATMLGLL